MSRPTCTTAGDGVAAARSLAARHAYWEARARRFIAGDWLSAVCAYDMPGFYNAAIALTQRRALAPWLADVRGRRVLDLGCGVGRWSLQMARAGATVTGVDWSQEMLDEAARRATDAGVAGRCGFARSDLREVALAGRYSLILCVTVLQHLVEGDDARAAVHAIARHLEPGGRFVMLEAAPGVQRHGCNTRTFRTRRAEQYAAWAAEAGLELEHVRGVDPSPLKWLYLPYYRSLPRWLARPALFALTALSLPVDLLLGRVAARASWHKVLVFRAPEPDTGREP